MTTESIRQIVALGTVTGMRSMAGPATLALTRGGPFAHVLPALAAAEMVVDKLPFIGARVNPLPLAGRAAMGALVGGVISAERRQNVLLGGLLGAATAVVAAHLFYEARRRLPLPGVAAGLLEDLAVVAIGDYSRRHWR